MSGKLLRKWTKWLDRIYGDLWSLIVNRHIFRQFADCIEPYAGTMTGAHLSRFIAQAYVAFAATAIRRITEKPNPKWKSISLVILLDDLKGHASDFSRVMDPIFWTT